MLQKRNTNNNTNEKKLISFENKFLQEKRSKTVGSSV